MENVLTEPPQPTPVIPIILNAEKPGEKLKEITNRLEQGIKEVFESDRYKEYLSVMSKFHNYSFNNTLLIAMQKPDASRIAGFNSWASQLQTLKTLIHEIAHAKLHDFDLKAPKEERADRSDRRTREVEAESIAYTVCQHYGLDTSDYSFGYVAGWSSGRELAELKSSLETIRSTANELINTIDGHIAEMQKEQTTEQTQAPTTEPATQENDNTFSIHHTDLQRAHIRAEKAKEQAEQQPPTTEPDSFLTGEKVQTPRGSFRLTAMSIDGVINNTPTVGELEAKVNAGEQISLTDLAAAIKADKQRGDTPKEKSSIQAQIKKSKEKVATKKATKTKNQELEI